MPDNTLEKKISIDSFFQNLDEISGELDRVDKKTDQALQEVKSSSIKAFSNENYFESLLKSLTEQEEIVQKVSSENQQQNTTINNLTNVVNQEGDTVKQTIVNQNQITNQISEVGDRVKSLEKSGEKVVDQILNLKKENNTENQQLSKAFQVLKQSYDSLSFGVQSVRTDVEGISQYLLKDQQQRRNLLEQRKLKKARETDVKEKSDIMSALKKALGSTKDQEMFGNIMSQQDYAAIKNPPGQEDDAPGGAPGAPGAPGGALVAAGGGAAVLSTMMGDSIDYVSPGKVTPVVSGRYGEQRTSGPHGGTDLAVNAGTPLRAISDGKIIDAGEDPGGWGNFVVFVDDKGIHHLYGHVQDGYRGKGDIKKGDIIAKVGMTGRTTGPHLHWETGTRWTGGVLTGKFDPLNRYSMNAPFSTAQTSSPSAQAKPAPSASTSPTALQPAPAAAPTPPPSYLPDPSKSLGANLRDLTSSAGTPGTAQQSSMAPLGEPTKEIKVSSADLPSPKEMEISSAQPQMKQMDPSSIVPFDTQQIASGGYSQAPRNQGQQSNITSTPDFPEAIPTSNPLTKMWTLSAINHLNINGSMDHIYG